ncbi:MAG: protein translocase subunit SecD [Actinobacteria bacterium]|nr:protein translocase subunit SecD [Actinomycetota bacterium]
MPVSTRRRSVLFLLVVIGLVCASIVVIATRPTVLGLDLQGGVEVVLQGKPTRDSEVNAEAIERSVEVIRSRVDAFGVSEPEIQTQGDDQIVATLAGATNPDRVVEDLIRPAQLLFIDYQANFVAQDPSLWKMVQKAQSTTPRPPVEGQASYYLFKKNAAHELVAGPDYEKASLLQDYGGKVPAGTEIATVPEGLVIFSDRQQLDPSKPDSPSRTVHVLMQDEPALTGRDITSAAQSFDTGSTGGNQEPIVTMQFTDRGAQNFQDVTRDLAQRGALRQELQSFAIVLDGKIISNPTVDYRQYPSGISGNNGAQISGNFTTESARTLADQLNSGAIPIRLDVISQKQVSATLGEESLRQGLIAAAAGLFLVVLFLVVYYRLLGVIAAGALIIYTLFYLAVAVLVPITLTLPGIAGAILTIGVAADANVVIFERIREEARAGRNAKSAILTGYSKGISAIIDANVVTFLTAAILFLFSTGGPKGFAFTLMVGVLISLFTAVVVTRVVIETLSNSKVLQNEKAMGITAREPRWKFDFVGKWRLWLAISFVPLAVGAAFIGIKGLNLGLDFNSGTRIAMAFEATQPTEGQVRAVLADEGFPEAKIQATTDSATGRAGFQIQTPTLQPKQLNDLKRNLEADIGTIDERAYQVETVGPTFGRQVVERAGWAILLSFAVIILYLTIRFEYRLALPALLSVIHDVWLAIAIFSLVGYEVTSATVAALLTILGYSLYDVVVVFDRIRENAPLMRNARYKDVVNRSVQETLTRSIITGLTAVFPVLMLFIFGGETLRSFSFALLVGLLTGGVSSILIAAPLAAIWKEHQPEGRKRARKAGKRAARESAAAYDSDVADLEVLARAEAALGDEDSPPSLMVDEEPVAEPAATSEPDAPAPAGAEAAAPAAPGALAPDATPDAPARPQDEAPVAPPRDDVQGTPDAPPKRERRHSQVKKRRRK